MTDSSSDKTSGLLTAKMFLIMGGSCLIYLSILAAGIAAVIAWFMNGGTGESFIIAFARTFFNFLYIPTLISLMIMVVAILAFAAIKLFQTGSTDSAKSQILVFAIFVFSVAGSVGPLLDYRPDPTITYLIVFAVLVAISLAIHFFLLFSVSTLSLTKRAMYGLLVFPYVPISIFCAMSFVQAMLLYVSPSSQAEGIVKVCSGIVSPLWAIACLFIPTVILTLLTYQKPPELKPAEG